MGRGITLRSQLACPKAVRSRATFLINLGSRFGRIQPLLFAIRRWKFRIRRQFGIDLFRSQFSKTFRRKCCYFGCNHHQFSNRIFVSFRAFPFRYFRSLFDELDQPSWLLREAVTRHRSSLHSSNTCHRLNPLLQSAFLKRIATVTTGSGEWHC